MKKVTFGTLFAASLLIVSGLQATVDSDWSTGKVWDDGQAEIAFYQLERKQDQYGRANPQSIVVGTYLVKHDFDAALQSKSSSGISAFKWALFYEFESGAYQYKRSWVSNVAQHDLRPLKMSFTSFDWCSNLYEELAFLPDGKVESLMRSDDYGNDTTTFRYAPDRYPAAQIPLLVRGLDFSEAKEQTFEVLLRDGKTVSARAMTGGLSSISTRAGTYEAEKITVEYQGVAPSILGEQAAPREHYFRGTGPERLLLKVESERYVLELIEHLRSPYWRDNFFSRLKEVRERP